MHVYFFRKYKNFYDTLEYFTLRRLTEDIDTDLSDLTVLCLVVHNRIVIKKNKELFSLLLCACTLCIWFESHDCT